MRGYELVIWGTAPASTDEVRAGYDGGEARGSVFTVEPSVATEVGADHSFGVVVVEVPVEAACGEVAVRVAGPASETVRIDPRPRLCDAAAS